MGLIGRRGAGTVLASTGGGAGASSRRSLAGLASTLAGLASTFAGLASTLAGFVSALAGLASTFAGLASALAVSVTGFAASRAGWGVSLAGLASSRGAAGEDAAFASRGFVPLDPVGVRVTGEPPSGGWLAGFWLSLFMFRIYLRQ